jgi:hypothetical protein
MKYAAEMGSGAVMYIPSFIKNGSGIQKSIGEIHIHRQHGDLISLLLSFQNKESRLKTGLSVTFSTKNPAWTNLGLYPR